MAGLPGTMAPTALVGMADIASARRRATRNLERMAEQMDAMAMTTKNYPSIPFNKDDRIREETLQKVGRAFQAEMDAQGNPCALKGGTALRFSLGLPRPSTDLDFEGDNRVEMKKSLKRALRNALPGEKYQIGLDWGKLGTITLRRAGWSKRDKPYLGGCPVRC